MTVSLSSGLFLIYYYWNLPQLSTSALGLAVSKSGPDTPGEPSALICVLVASLCVLDPAPKNESGLPRMNEQKEGKRDKKKGRKKLH